MMVVNARLERVNALEEKLETIATTLLAAVYRADDLHTAILKAKLALCELEQEAFDLFC